MSYNSPPCFLHELDASYLGYLGPDEVLDLLTELLAAELAGTRVEEAWVHAMLLRHIARIDGTIAPKATDGFPAAGETRLSSTTSACDQEGLEARLGRALPRLRDEALRRDLEDVRSLLEHGRQGGARRHG